MIATRTEATAVSVRHPDKNTRTSTASPDAAGRSLVPAALPARSLLLEGEDAGLNGMTRSLQRRLFGLNLSH